MATRPFRKPGARKDFRRPIKPAKMEIKASSNRDRAIFNDISKQYQGNIITQSYLRLETALGVQSRIDFNILKNESSPLNVERRLSINDAFTAYDMAIMIRKHADTTEQYISTLDTFPNAITYAKAGEAGNLMAIYNGYTSITVNNIVYVDSLDNMRFYRVGDAQQGVDLGAGTGASPNVYLADSYPSSNYPFAPLTPGITFSGGAKNEIEVTLPASADLTGTASTNYCVAYFRGLLINNGAKFNT